MVTPTMRETSQEYRREWAGIGRISASVAAIGFLAGTALYLIDATDLIATMPQYHATSAGPLQDEANFWVAIFAHRRDILWDIWARDLILPVAFGGLIVASLALRRLAGRQRPEAELMTTFILIGGMVSALADLRRDSSRSRSAFSTSGVCAGRRTLSPTCWGVSPSWKPCSSSAWPSPA